MTDIILPSTQLKPSIHFTLKYCVAFLALLFVMHEAHEIAHTTIGRLLCGCWGQRDFNVWGLCESCVVSEDIGFIATMAGPLFSFIMMWWGASMLKTSNSNTRKSLGYGLIFANMPFARILTAVAMGGGDEVYTLRHFLDNDTLAWVLGSVAILAICAFPLYKAYTAISRRRLPWFLLFFILPLFIDLVVVLLGLNTLLEHGVLAEYWVLGSPMIVTLWTVLVILIFMLSRKHIYTLLK
jgi:hypothetical protein